MSAIVRTHWANVKAFESGQLFAFWPETTAYSEPLALAGVMSFEETDAAWLKGFEQMVRSLLQALAFPDADGVARLVAAATTAHAAPCELESNGCVVVTQAGCPIVFTWLRSDRVPSWKVALRSLAAGRPLEEMKLDWESVLPKRFTR